MLLSPGRELSHYRLVAQIGEGGMGVVWRATDTTLGRDVAIKVLPEAFAGDPERMARFEREARVLASLNHPHVASIYGVGSAAGVRFLAMELVEGDDLARVIARGPIPVAESVEIARQIAEALEAAHEKGVIHRDLKPANVKLTAEGQVKVLDFGLAKALEAEGAPGSGASMTHSPTLTSPMTAANVILGTAAYMAPEQARGKTVDRRADIWAFGCVLYECLTARRAFPGDTVSDTIAKILEREPDLSALPGAVPPKVRDLLQRCLDKDPKRRLRDIGDARITLEEVLASRSASGRLLMADTSRGAAARSRAGWRLPLLAGLVGMMAGGALWFEMGPHGGDTATRCVTISLPPNVSVQSAQLSRDGSTMIVRGQAQVEPGSAAKPERLYVRALDHYEFKEVPGTDGVVNLHPASDAHTLYFYAPASPGSSIYRLAKMPCDGSSPATTVAELKLSWRLHLLVLENGDQVVFEGRDKLVRMPAGGKAPITVQLDAGRPGVSRYELRAVLPGSLAGLVDVVAYDARGWHYSVGVVDLRSGKVRIVVEDGGSAVYSPTGHLLFARGDAILAMPFDLGNLETHGAPVAVWGGLSTPYSFVPAIFQVTDDGSLFYRPGQLGGERTLATIDASGKVTPWSTDRRAVDTSPVISPDGRRFACTIANNRGLDEVWMSSLEAPGLQRLETDPDADAGPLTWSPDGRRIAYFRSAKDGKDGIYTQAADGGAPTLILKHDEYVPAGWLPDGSALLVTHRGVDFNTAALLTVAGAATDTSRLHPIPLGRFNVFWMSLSHDGRRLAYIGDENGPTGSVSVVELRPDGSVSRAVPVPAENPQELHWASNGSVLYIHDQRGRILKAAVLPGAALAFAPPVEAWDGNKLGIWVWNVLPDGRLFVGLKNDNEGDPTQFSLVLHWAEELKRKMRAAGK